MVRTSSCRPEGWRVQIGPDFVSTYGPLRQFLNRKNMFSWNPTNTDPGADRALRSQAEAAYKRGLAADCLRSAADHISTHGADYSAQTATTVNAYSASFIVQTPFMSDARKTFWQRLTECWGQRELPTSQLGIAKELGMSQGSVGRWARDEGLPELDVVRALALKGDCSVEWLLTGRGQKRPMPMDEETNELLEIWRRLRSNERHHVRLTAQGQLALQTAKAPLPVTVPGKSVTER